MIKMTITKVTVLLVTLPAISLSAVWNLELCKSRESHWVDLRIIDTDRNMLIRFMVTTVTSTLVTPDCWSQRRCPVFRLETRRQS